MPTFGKLTDGAGASASTANKTAVSTATPSASGVVVAGHMRMWIASGSTTTAMVIYADSGGSPAALLAQSDALTLSNTSEAQVDYTFSGSNQIAIVNGTAYWIGVSWQANTGGVNVSRDSTAAGRLETGAYLPNPFGTPTSLSGPIDAFIDFVLPSSPLAYVSQYSSYH